MNTKKKKYKCIECRATLDADSFVTLECGQRARKCNECRQPKETRGRPSTREHEWLTPDEKLSMKYLMMKF